MYQDVPRRIDNSIILILLRTRVRLPLIDFLSNMLLFYVLYKSYVRQGRSLATGRCISTFVFEIF